MKTIGTFKTELIYISRAGNQTSFGIIPPDMLAALEANMKQFDLKTKLFSAADRETGDPRSSLGPIQRGRKKRIDRRGIRDGDRFLATFDVKEVARQRGIHRQMWLVSAQPLRPTSQHP